MIRSTFALLLGIASSLAAAQTPTQVRVVETLRLDANAEDFSVVGPVRIGPAGQIAITFRQDAQIRVYDSTGKRLTSFGRKGQGPGEFGEMQVQGWRGDTVWVYDYRQYRHTFVTQTGRLVRVVRMADVLNVRRANTAGPLTSPLAVHAMLADGTMLGLACLRPTANGSHFGVVRATPTGETTALVLIPGMDDRCQPRFAAMNPLVFTPQTVFRPDGSSFAQIRVDSMARKGTFTLALFDGSGRLLLTKSFPFVGEPIPTRVVDSMLAAMTWSPKHDPEGLTRQGTADAIAKARANIPPVYVPINGMLLGQDGTMWVFMRGPSSRTSALVLDGSGNRIAVVTIPARSDVIAGSATQMWVRERDDDGLTSIVRYRVEGIRCARPACR